MLKLERVSKFYSANGMVSTGFSKVDLSFHMGEFVAITGESGSGKSTLLNVISGLDSYEEGEMYVMGQPTSGYSGEDLESYRKKYIGNIFQTFNLVNSYTVYQNVELVLLLSGYDAKQIPSRVKEIIEKVGLSGFEKKKASKLSGGQKQRVAIARALAKETPIIVADEPTGNLDSQSASEIISLLHELSKDKLIIIVTHNYDQVEPYVTRKITMHDGRVTEDKMLQPFPALQAEDIEPAKADGLSFFSQFRLGFRNTFNIPAKFSLLLMVFLFLCTGVIAMYATVQNMASISSGGWNQYFTYTGEDRVLVTKADRSEFTKADYEALAGVDNVRDVVENDLTLDLMTYITDDYENGTIWMNANLTEAKIYEEQLEKGRMPKNSKEAILMVPKDGYVAGHIEETLNKKVHVSDDRTGALVFKEKIKLVGYGYLTAKQQEELEYIGRYTEGYLCVNEKSMDHVRMVALERYCDQEIQYADAILQGSSSSGMYPLMPSDYVEEGEIYIPEDMTYVSTQSPYGQTLKIINKSLYFEDQYTFTVVAPYNKDNCYYYLGIENYDEINNTALYISPKDYKKIFDKENFQSSVLTADKKMTSVTAKAIEDLGYKTFVVSDGLMRYDQEIEPIYNIFRTLLLVGVLVVLFFVTYFIVKLILKSRNVYFSTIRMLGATYANAGNLLKVELFAVFNLAFAVCASAVAVIKQELIKAEELQELVSYLEMGDFVVLYVLICIMTIMQASRYAKQLFKQTAMNAYKEEV
ncbi:MAG: ABC transporter ATP-binding protein [Firmicutes bacterium]|nr:ABC transporter ATP-binding protein [Bacillota bacterium]